MIIRFLAALCAAVFALAAAAEAQQRDRIVFGVVATEQSEAVLSLWEPFVEDMRRDTGLDVELRTAGDYAGVIEAMRANQVHIAWLTNRSGLEAARRANAEVFAKFIYPDGQEGYRAIIIVPRDSPLQNLEDLLACDRTVNFGMGDPLSTSGTLVPNAYIFAARGIDPQTCFNNVSIASHEQNALAIANGYLDAAVNNSTNLVRLARLQPETLARMRVIWESPLIQTDPIMWRIDLAPDIKTRVMEFFLTYGWRGGVEQRAHEQHILRELEMGGFLPATDDHFLPVIRMELIQQLAETLNRPDLGDGERAERVAELEAELNDLARRERMAATRDLSANIVMARERVLADPDNPTGEVEEMVSRFLADQPRPVQAALIDRRRDTGVWARVGYGALAGLIMFGLLFAASRPARHAPQRLLSDRLIDAAVWGGLFGLLVWSFWPAEVFKLPLLAENADRMGEYVGGFVQLDWGDWRTYVNQTMVTVQIALWGTFIAVILAIPFGLLGARNIAPVWIVQPVRRLMDALRAINELVVAAVFVAAVGLGPFAGVMALAFHTAGVLAKLFSEAVESIDEGPVEGVRATGATPLNEVTWAVIPQVIPLWVSYALYRFESNTRAATILGLIGAGGIGQVLIENIRSFQYGKTAAIILIIIVAVTLVDLLSQLLRKRLV